jgi:hypothetical protein
LLLAAMWLGAIGPRAAFAWGDRAHAIITEEAVRRLPEPLQDLLFFLGAEPLVLWY